MPTLKEPLTEEEMALYEIVTIPAVFGEFVRSSPEEPEEKQWRYWPQQVREMNREETHKKRFQGRNLGKTITCMDEMNSMVLLYDGVETGMALIGTRAQPNLQPIFDAQAALWQYNRFLKHFLIKDTKRAIDRKNYEIRLFRDNRAMIKGRIQGKDGQGFNTVHPNICAWIDEAQYIDRNAIAEFYGMISGELPLIASGVPNGWRMSWAYQIDTDASWGFVGGRMTRLEDPRSLIDPNWIANLERTYGGRESNLFKQKVLGEWGSASTMTFNVDLITFDQPSFPPQWYRTVNVDTGNFKSRADLYELFAIGPWLPLDRFGDIVVHADHGITGAGGTTGYVSFYDNKEKAWRQYLRFILRGLQVLDQVEVFDFLATELNRATKVKPQIGLDITNFGGRDVISILEKGGRWPVFKANFSEKVKMNKRPETQEEVNKRLQKDPWSDPTPQWVDQEVVLKQVAIPTLSREMYAGNVWIVNDTDIVGQLNATTDHETATGRIVYETDYTKEEDATYNHDLQAFEVFAAMLHQRDFSVDPVQAPELWVQEMDIGWGQDNPYEPYSMLEYN
jgi:hypothetical protein